LSRPVYEPTPARYDAYNDFGNQQLFRRPSTAGVDCSIQYFRAARYLTPVTTGTGTTQITVDWDAWEFCDENVFTPLDTSLNPDPIPGVDQVRRVRLDYATYPGRYTFVFEAHNSSSIAGSVEMSMHDGDDIWGRPESVLHAPTGALTVGFFVFNLSKIYPLFDPISASGGFTAEISFTIAQNSGASEDFSELLMEIHYEPCVNICPPGSS
jgi:hypothetical protein